MRRNRLARALASAPPFLYATTSTAWAQAAATDTAPDGTLARNEWLEIPASGTLTRGLKAPAALLMVKPADDQHSHH